MANKNDSTSSARRLENASSCKCTNITNCSGPEYIYSDNCFDGIETISIGYPSTLKDGPSSPSDGIANATFYLMEDLEGYYRNIAKEYGIEKDWIKIDRKYVRIKNGCQYSVGNIQDCIDNNNDFWCKYPVNDNVNIFNPKDLIGQRYDASMDLLGHLKVLQADGYDESLFWFDLAHASLLPAFTMEEVVTSTNKIVKEKQDSRKGAQGVYPGLHQRIALLHLLHWVGTRFSRHDNALFGVCPDCNCG